MSLPEIAVSNQIKNMRKETVGEQDMQAVASKKEKQERYISYLKERYVRYLRSEQERCFSAKRLGLNEC